MYNSVHSECGTQATSQPRSGGPVNTWRLQAVRRPCRAGSDTRLLAQALARVSRPSAVSLGGDPIASATVFTARCAAPPSLHCFARARYSPPTPTRNPHTRCVGVAACTPSHHQTRPRPLTMALGAGRECCRAPSLRRPCVAGHGLRSPRRSSSRQEGARTAVVLAAAARGGADEEEADGFQPSASGRGPQPSPSHAAARGVYDSLSKPRRVGSEYGEVRG